MQIVSPFSRSKIHRPQSVYLRKGDSLTFDRLKALKRILISIYRVFQVSCMIKNRNISALRTARDLPKTSTWSL